MVRVITGPILIVSFFFLMEIISTDKQERIFQLQRLTLKDIIVAKEAKGLKKAVIEDSEIWILILVLNRTSIVAILNSGGKFTDLMKDETQYGYFNKS